MGNLQLTNSQTLKVFKLADVFLLYIISYSYIYILIVHYQWISFRLHQTSIPYHSPSVCITLPLILNFFVVLLLPKKLYKTSDGALWLMYILAFVPTEFIPHLTLMIDPEQVCLFNIYTAAAFALIMLMTKLPRLKVKRLRLASAYSTYMFTAGTVLTLLSILIYKFKNYISILSIYNVYQQRAEYKKLISVFGGWLAYLVIWMYFVFVPILLTTAYSLYLRQRKFSALIFVALAVMSAYFSFSLAGFKSAFFSIFAVFAVIMLIRRGMASYKLLLYLMLIYLLAYLLTFFGNDWYLLHMMRRFLASPGLNAAYYFEFFSQNPKMYMSHSFLSSFFANPYGTSPPFVIGYIYYDNPQTSANANFWADAYANFSTLGIFVYSFLLGLILLILDSITYKHRLEFSLGALIMSLYSLSNSGLFTNLVTYGLVFIILYLWISPPTQTDTFGNSSRKKVHTG